MTLHGWIALAILAAAALLFTKRWLPLEVTALAIPLALLATGLATTEEALSGFRSLVVITLGAVFVIGAGLQESGVTTLVARLLQRFAGHGEATLVFLLMIVVAVVSAFMSNQAVVAAFIPAVMTLSRRTLVAPSRLLMPLAFAAVLGGNLTLIGTQSNMIVASMGASRFGADVGVLDFARVGIPIVLAGTLYAVLAGRKLLPQRTEAERLRETLLPEEVAKSYGLSKTLFHMRVNPKSSIVGKSIADSGIRSKYNLDVVAVVRQGKVRKHYHAPRPDLVLGAGDELYVEGDDVEAWRFADYETVQFGLAGTHEIEDILARGMTLAEVALPPRSEVFGKTLKDLAFRKLHGLNVLSIWRKGEAISKGVADVPLELGDALLVAGPADNVKLLAQDPDYIVLTDHTLDEDVSRAPAALVLLLLAVVPPILGWMTVPVAALASAVLMVATGCLDARRIARVVDWRVLFVIIGTLPLGLALEHSGVAAVVADGALALARPAGGLGVLAAVFVMTALLSLATTNSTAAVVVCPIAAKVAVEAGLPVHDALLAVAYGASCAFVLPQQPWNLLVMGPGGYEARDYLRMGGWMSVVVAVTAILGLWLT